jgi:flagellar biosynthesis/type III secretory pathway chaperone
VRHTDETDRVTRLLERQLACVAALLDALRQEQTALTRNDVDGLETAVAAKHRHLSQLDLLSRQIDGVLESTGIRDMDASLGARRDTAAEGAWKKLRRALGECRLQNQINGSLIEQNHRRARAAWYLLTGQNGGNDTYRPDGAAPPPARLFVRA